MEWTGIPAETIGNCFDNVIEVKEPHGKKYDFIFCGRTGYRLAQHVARYNKLAEIASRTDLQIWGYRVARNNASVGRETRNGNGLFGRYSNAGSCPFETFRFTRQPVGRRTRAASPSNPRY